MPVAKLLRRISNIGGGSPVSAGVGEVEALVHHWEVRDDVAEDGLAQGRPVLQGRVFDLAAGQAAVCGGANPMEDFPTPPLHIAERHLVGWRIRHIHPRGAVW